MLGDEIERLVFSAHDKFAGLEQLDFFFQLFFQRGEVFLVGFAEMSENTNVRVNHFFQSAHLARQGDAGLDDGDVGLSVDSQQ